METFVSILGPVIAAAIIVVGGAWAYRWQKTVDRQTALIELRRKAYRRFLTAFISMSRSTNTTEEITRELVECEYDLLLVASDEVAKCVGLLSTFYHNTNSGRFNRNVKKSRLLIANVCKAMREDCFEESTLTLDEFQKLVMMT